MTKKQGLIHYVYRVNLGSTVDGAQSTGPGVSLKVAPYTKFVPEGGSLYLPRQGVVLNYASYKESTSELLLTSSEEVDLEDGDVVELYPNSYQKRALVVVPYENEPLDCVVPFGMQATLPEGPRNSPTEYNRVYVDQINNDWVIENIEGTAPVLDYEVVPKSDGLPPSEAPNITVEAFAVGGLSVQWERITNPDPVVYEIHASTSSPVPENGTAYLGDVSGTSFVFSKIGGTSISTSAPTYVKVRARDFDGVGPFSLQASGTPTSVDLDQLEQDLEDLADDLANKSKIWYEPTAPPGTSHNVGDTWFDSANDNKIYKWDGDSWEPAVLGNDAFGNFSATKITTGVLNAARIGANSITTDKLGAGSVVASTIGAGAVTASSIAAGSITVDKFAAGTVEALEISADQITAGTFQAELGLASRMIVGDNIEIDGASSSIVLYSSPEFKNPTVQLNPIESYFKGFLESTNLNVDGTMSIRGPSYLRTQTTLRMEERVRDPNTPLYTSNTTLSTRLQNAAPANKETSIYWDPVDSRWLRTSAGSRVVERFTLDGTDQTPLTLAEPPTGINNILNIVRSGSFYYTLENLAGRPKATGGDSAMTFQVNKYNASTGAFILTVTNSTKLTSGDGNDGAMGIRGDEIIVGYCNFAESTGTGGIEQRYMRISALSDAVTASGTTPFNVNLHSASSLSLETYTDGSPNNQVATGGLSLFSSGGGRVQSYGENPTGDPNNPFSNTGANGQIVNSGITGNMAKHPTLGWHVSVGGTLQRLSSFRPYNVVGGVNPRVWLRYLFKNSTTGWTTVPSSAQDVNYMDNRFLQVQVPQLPSDVTEIQLFTALGATAPAASAFRQRPETPTTVGGSTSYLIDFAIPATTTAIPSAVSFPNNPAAIQSWDGLAFTVRGDGSGHWTGSAFLGSDIFRATVKDAALTNPKTELRANGLQFYNNDLDTTADASILFNRSNSRITVTGSGSWPGAIENQAFHSRRLSEPQGLPSGVEARVLFATQLEDRKPTGYSSCVSWDNTNREFTATYTGRYTVQAHILWLSSNAGQRTATLWASGLRRVYSDVVLPGAGPLAYWNQPLQRTLWLTAGDKIYVTAAQFTGSNSGLHQSAGTTLEDTTIDITYHGGA